MIHTRTLQEGSEADVDILFIKQRLYNMGLFETKIDSMTKTEFDEETTRAVLNFQERNRDVDGSPFEQTGKIDSDIWNAILREHNIFALARDPIFTDESVIPNGESIGMPFAMPANISPEKAEKIAMNLSGISNRRRMIVMEALKLAYDPAVPRYYPISLYIRGRTSYSKHNQVEPAIVTDEVIDQQVSTYSMTDAKLRLMRETIAFDKKTIGADDCGGIIGLCHLAKVCKIGADLTAKVMVSDRYSTAITREELSPGDWVYKVDHIGLYVGGGYSVEWIGGAYGCQLTSMDEERIVYNFIKSNFVKLSMWDTFRRPKWY